MIKFPFLVLENTVFFSIATYVTFQTPKAWTPIDPGVFIWASLDMLIICITDSQERKNNSTT